MTVEAAPGPDAGDVSVLDRCRDHVVAHDHEFTWASAWKSSPDRRLQARAVYRVAGDDGFGRVRLEVRRLGEAVAYCSSPDAVAATTSRGLRRYADTLRWAGSTEVGVTPLVGQGRDREACWSRDSTRTADGCSVCATTSPSARPVAPGSTRTPTRRSPLWWAR